MTQICGYGIRSNPRHQRIRIIRAADPCHPCMLLGIDASRAAGVQKTGVGWYCYHLIAHLKEVIPDDIGVVLYSDQPLPEELKPWPRNWVEKILHWPPVRAARASDASNRSSLPRWPLWSQIRLAYQVLRDRPDVLFIPAHVLPIILAILPRRCYSPIRTNRRIEKSHSVRLVTTIHDVAFKEFPESYSSRERWYADHATKLAVRHADRIIVPTDAVRRDLERWYGCRPHIVTVVSHGVHTEKRIVVVERPLATRHSQLDAPYLLYIGRLERKKNVVRMIEAFSRATSARPHARLVLAGPPGFGYDEIRAAIDRSPEHDRIIELGWIDERQRADLLQRAAVFLFPTLGEGFGLPILEAMAAGVPVMTSRGGAHEEVAGGAAMLVTPDSVEGIVDAINRLLNDAQLRHALAERGRQRASAFPWSRCAQRTWHVLSA